MQAHVLYAEGAHVFLQLHVGSGFEGCPFAQHHEVVVQRKAHFGDVRAFQQFDDGQGQPYQVQSEQEAMVVGRHLQQRDLVYVSLAERRPRFGVDAQYRLSFQVSCRLICFFRRVHYVYIAGEGRFGQFAQFLFSDGSSYDHSCSCINPRYPPLPLLLPACCCTSLRGGPVVCSPAFVPSTGGSSPGRWPASRSSSRSVPVGRQR